MAQHNEIEIEREICEYLVAHGWLYSPNDAGYDRELALFPEDVFGWLADTQADQLTKHLKPGLTGSARESARRGVLRWRRPWTRTWPRMAAPSPCCGVGFGTSTRSSRCASSSRTPH